MSILFLFHLLTLLTGKICFYPFKYIFTHIRKWQNIFTTSRPGLTLTQNKYVFWESRSKGTTKIRPQRNLFYQQDIRLKNIPKIKNSRKNEIKHLLMLGIWQLCWVLASRGSCYFLHYASGRCGGRPVLNAQISFNPPMTTRPPMCCTIILMPHRNYKSHLYFLKSTGAFYFHGIIWVPLKL